ncbi:RHS repeat domain-containing protein [Chitinophaga rhizophila]|uniref:YD repeat-containing protein n=1 Tax=Chitinophaga rhizophila TaxID=2866212 RepID=A0ABS7G6N2_9BACT|nr:hypothetical protein [Chitinophaga rhizophila]MBW8683306.1 hypothetical protein [Chitinophaga rhizophila]
MLLYQSLTGAHRFPGAVFIVFLLLSMQLPLMARQQQHLLPQLVPQSHDVLAIQNSVRIPASESIGIPDISIPLADLRIGSFPLPIRLRYHRSGLKVDEIPSSVGDGWSLHYGGVISFRQNGLHDFKPGGLFDSGTTSLSMTNLKSFLKGHMSDVQRNIYLEQVVNGNADAAFDQYYYNFSGTQGTFYFDTMMNVVTAPKRDFRIFRLNNEISILDNQHNNYYFAAVEPSRAEDSSIAQYNPAFNDIAAYYLSRIVTNENRTILFKYKKYSYTIQQKRSAIQFTPATGICGADNGMNTYSHTREISCLLPDSIIFDQGIVKFIVSTLPREDIKTLQDSAAVPYISGLRIFAGNNKKIKDYRFVQSYFDTNKRLKLSAIQEWNGSTLDKQWLFSYYNENDTFPALFSNDQDHWGYYNAAGNTGLIPDVNYAALIPGWTDPVLNYARRHSDSAAVYGMLQSIVFPTGGSVAYEYEPNQVKVEDYTQLTLLSPFLTTPVGTPAPYLVGGVRLKTIITNDSTGTPSSYKTYSYADSLRNIALPDIPYYISNLQHNRDSAGSCVSCALSATVFDHSIRAHEGVPIVYSRVTVYDSSIAGMQGKTENVYLLPVNAANTDTLPDIPPVTTSWYMVQLLNRKVYTIMDSAYQLVKEHRHTYNELNRQYLTTGIQAGYTTYCPLEGPANNSYQVSQRVLFSDRFSLLQSSETDYFSGQTLTRQTDYSITSDRHTLPSIVTKPNSKGEQIHERTIYSFDYDTAAITTADAIGIRNLRRLNVLKPIEQIQYRTIDGIDYVTGATLTTYRQDRPFPDKVYQLSLNTPLPMSEYTLSSITGGNLIKDSRYELITTFSSYDANNNVTEMTGIDGIPVSYLYAYKQQYKIAEVLNARRSMVLYTSFETEETGGWSYSGTPVSDTTSPVGERCYDLSSGTLFVAGLNFPTGILTYWKKGNTPISFPSEIPFTPVRGRTVNGWTFFLHWISGGFTQHITFPSSGIIDDLRFFPMSGQMTSYSYQPHTGMTSVCDDRGNITYYSYDETGRLNMVKDGEKNIIKLIDYQYQQPITQ